MDKPIVTMYSDGCHLLGRDDGGWGVLLLCNGVEDWRSGYLLETNSSRAELTAIIEGLRALKVRCIVTVYCDNQDIVRSANGLNRRLANRDLWDQFEALDAVHEVKYVWIRGHDGNLGNERAHRLADRAARKLPML